MSDSSKIRSVAPSLSAADGAQMNEALQWGVTWLFYRPEVVYVKRTTAARAYYIDAEDCLKRERYCAIDKLLAYPLSLESATWLCGRLMSSRALRDDEHRKSDARHVERTSRLIAEALRSSEAISNAQGDGA